RWEISVIIPMEEIIGTVEIVERVKIEGIVLVICCISRVSYQTWLIGSIIVLDNVPSINRHILPGTLGASRAYPVIGFVPHQKVCSHAAGSLHICGEGEE